jgi:nitrite reductase/ring-hydroxylating ferredoxin subunit
MPADTSTDTPIELCASADLAEGGLAVPFDIAHAGENLRAFAVRFEGRVHAYLNRCTHVAMELDWQPNRFFDDTGQWLLCASHGAVYAPDTGEGVAGPCQGGLLKIELTEADGTVRWQPTERLRPVVF